MYLLSFVGPSIDRIFSSHTIYLFPCRCGIFTPWYVFLLVTIKLLWYANFSPFEMTEDSKWTYCSFSFHQTEISNTLFFCRPISGNWCCQHQLVKKAKEEKNFSLLCPGLMKDSIIYIKCCFLTSTLKKRDREKHLLADLNCSTSPPSPDVAAMC